MDKIHGTKNSHIQLPKSILEGFSFQEKITNEMGYPETKNYIYCMDMEGNITKIDISDANVQHGYYENEVEELFSLFESAFGEVKAKIKAALKSREKGFLKLSLPQNTESVIKKYCALCLIRSEEFVKGIAKKSLFIDVLANTPPNVVAYTYMRKPELVDKLFESKSFSFAFSTATKFILPQRGMYLISRSNSFDVYIPISPNIAIVLTEYAVIDNDGVLIVGEANDHDVEILNKIGIKTEIKYNQRAIYAQSEDDLIKYRDFLLSLKEGN